YFRMALQWLYAVASVLVVSLLSLIGLATISLSEEKLREVIFVMVVLATGSLFVDAFIHLVPQSFRQSAKPVHTSLLILAGALLFNFLSACAAILGTVLALVIGSSATSFSAAVLPVAAGGFIYIAGSDLVPELHKERSFPKSVAQLMAIGAGIGLMLCLTLIE